MVGGTVLVIVGAIVTGAEVLAEVGENDGAGAGETESLGGTAAGALVAAVGAIVTGSEDAGDTVGENVSSGTVGGSVLGAEVGTEVVGGVVVGENESLGGTVVGALVAIGASVGESESLTVEVAAADGELCPATAAGPAAIRNSASSAASIAIATIPALSVDLFT